MPWIPGRRFDLWRLIVAGCLGITLSAVDPPVASATQADPPPQRRPEGPFRLDQASAESAFQRLGERFGCAFALSEPSETWTGPSEGVTVTADLSQASFWEAVLAVGEQTGYEPVFRPYGNSGDRPVVFLRRVNVRAEEETRPAVSAGPLLIRSSRATFSVPLETARLRLVPVQAALETEVFLEPDHPAIYVTAVALRAQDERGVPMVRAEGLDPTASFEQGIARLIMHFDAPRRVPEAIGQWRGQLRIISQTKRGAVQAPVTVQVVRSPGATRPTSSAATRPASGSGDALAPSRPTSRPVVKHAMGPYELLVEPVAILEEEAQGQRPAHRMATLRITFPRAQAEITTWMRLYGFLISMPPQLLATAAPAPASGDATASPWRLRSYGVVGPPSAEDPTLAGTYLVWAQFEADPGAANPRQVNWELPIASREERTVLAWPTPVPIEPPPEAPDRERTLRPRQ